MLRKNQMARANQGKSIDMKVAQEKIPNQPNADINVHDKNFMQVCATEPNDMLPEE